MGVLCLPRRLEEVGQAHTRLGYTVVLRDEQAATYLPQWRRRGFLICIRTDARRELCRRGLDSALGQQAPNWGPTVRQAGL